MSAVDSEKTAAEVAVHLHIAYAAIEKALEELADAVRKTRSVANFKTDRTFDLLNAEAHLITARERISDWKGGAQ